MNRDSSVGRVLTVDEACQFYQRCADAEKIMGKLSTEERKVILSTVGKDITLEDLQDMLAGKKVLNITSNKETQ